MAYITELCKIGSTCSAPPDVFADCLFDLFYLADLFVALISVLRSLPIFFLGEKRFSKSSTASMKACFQSQRRLLFEFSLQQLQCQVFWAYFFLFFEKK